MPPRKVAAAAPADGAEEVQAPRRSGRLASSGTGAPETPAPKETAKKPTKKRTAEEGEAGTGVKKAKKAQAAEDVTEDVAPGDDPNPASAKLSPIDIGDVLPSVTLKNEKDEDVDVQSLTTENGLVLFLVPKADTPGCTKQACAFRDDYTEFTKLGYNVQCLSTDTTTAQAKWQTKQSLPYPLLSDRKRVLIGALGAADGTKTKRSHFIFEKGGKLVDKKVPVKPLDSPKLALEFVKNHSSGA